MGWDLWARAPDWSELDLLGELEHAASQLREQGWTVDVHVEHPKGGGVPI